MQLARARGQRAEGDLRLGNVRRHAHEHDGVGADAALRRRHGTVELSAWPRHVAPVALLAKGKVDVSAVAARPVTRRGARRPIAAGRERQGEVSMPRSEGACSAAECERRRNTRRVCERRPVLHHRRDLGLADGRVARQARLDLKMEARVVGRVAEEEEAPAASSEQLERDGHGLAVADKEEASGGPSVEARAGGGGRKARG